MDTSNILNALERLYHSATDLEVNPQERHRAEKEALDTLRRADRDPMAPESLRTFQRRKRRSIRTSVIGSLCEVRVLRPLKVSLLDVPVTTVKVGQILSYDPARPGLFADRQWWGGPTLDYAFEGEEPALAVESEDG